MTDSKSVRSLLRSDFVDSRVVDFKFRRLLADLETALDLRSTSLSLVSSVVGVAVLGSVRVHCGGLLHRHHTRTHTHTHADREVSGMPGLSSDYLLCLCEGVQKTHESIITCARINVATSQHHGQHSASCMGSLEDFDPSGRL